ncbi:MAG: phosphopantothenate/pantothenate synthetase [Candidatus Nitrosocaldus sp.]|nr:phosphopantothenate/pantothenate synthetase [Candidatus Nitrosocaldus sp.]
MIPENHPRAESLRVRDRLVECLRRGIVVEQGLIAHGRGEAFDYLLGERTTMHAREAIRASVAMMLLAEHPVISVNGNVACLCARDVVRLASILNARIEVNLFYRSYERERAIEMLLRENGAEMVYGVGERASMSIPELMSERRRVDRDGIYMADVVLVPLEDGDRTEALVRMGKKVIAIDLNPLSRTARSATITIVDNVTRAVPLMVDMASRLRGASIDELHAIVNSFSNAGNLEASLAVIRDGVERLGGGEVGSS